MQVTPAEVVELFQLLNEKKAPVLPIPSSNERGKEKPQKVKSITRRHTREVTKKDTTMLILDTLKQEFSSKTFSYKQAVKLVLDRLDRRTSTARDALKYGKDKRLLFIAGYGLYSFIPPIEQEYRIPENALVDIMSGHLAPIATAFKIIGKIRSYATILINQSAVSARFMDSDQIGMLDLQIQKEFFKHYYCKSNVKITAEISDINRVLKSTGKQGAFHLLLQQGQPEDSGYYQVGDHKLSFEKCITSEQEFTHNLPAPVENGNEVIIAKSVLVDVLKNVRAGSSKIDVILEADRLSFASASSQYSKTLHNDGHDLKITKPINTTVQATYDVNMILPIISALGRQIEHVTIRLEGDLLSLLFPLNEHIRLQYLLAPIKPQVSAVAKMV